MTKVVIRPSRGWSNLGVEELWAHRELLWFLALRDVRVRYKQTALGAAWALFQPLTMVLVFSVFFGRVAKIESDGLPYPLFSLAALVPWTFFVAGLGRASGGLLSSSSLITKVYFPRLVVPLAAVVAAIPDFLLSLFVLAGMLLWHGASPSATAGLLVPLSVLTAAAAAGFGMWISALAVRYRDLHHLMTFLTQIWLYVTPIIYPLDYVVTRLERLGIPGWAYGLNPLAGIIASFRAALLGRPDVPWTMLGVSTLVVLVVFLTGAYFFRRTERTFADVI